jgi:hypothetical protein
MKPPALWKIFLFTALMLLARVIAFHAGYDACADTVIVVGQKVAAGGGGGGTFTFIDSVSALSGNQTDVTTAAIDTTGATLLVAVLTDFAETTFSDSKSNTWTSLTKGTQFISTRIVYCVPSSVGSGHTFSASVASGFPSICVAAFSGAHATPVDQQNGSTGNGITSIQPGSVTPTEDNELVIVGVGLGNGNAAGIDMAGYTVPEEVYYNGNAFTCALAYNIQTSATATNPTWTWTGNEQGVARIATFKAQ